MDKYVMIREHEGADVVELPCENDGTLLLTTLQGQYSGACGLKYMNETSGTTRGVRLTDGRLHCPDNDAIVYMCVFAQDKVEKVEQSMQEASGDGSLDNQKCIDLIIRGLSLESNEDDLKEHFSQFGETVYVEVKMDPISKKSRGFGFIRFSDIDGQNRALQHKDHVIADRACYVEKSQSQVGSSAQDTRKLFVRPVTEDMTEDGMRSFFSNYGTVIDMFIPRPFRGFAFVTFEDAASAAAILDQELVYEGNKLSLSSALPKNESKYEEYGYFTSSGKRRRGDGRDDRSSKRRRGGEQVCTDLIILGLPFKTTEVGLQKYFEKFGKVVFVQVKMYPNTTRSRGFGFVRFENYKDQLRALDSEHVIDQRPCEVKMSNASDQEFYEFNRRIFVPRLKSDVTEDDLKDYFGKFGEITDVLVPRPFRGFAFLTFLDPEVAVSLLEQDHYMKGSMFQVCIARPRDDQMPKRGNDRRRDERGAGSGGDRRRSGRGGGEGGSGRRRDDYDDYDRGNYGGRRFERDDYYDDDYHGGGGGGGGGRTWRRDMDYEYDNYDNHDSYDNYDNQDYMERPMPSRGGRGGGMGGGGGGGVGGSNAGPPRKQNMNQYDNNYSNGNSAGPSNNPNFQANLPPEIFAAALNQLGLGLLKPTQQQQQGMAKPPQQQQQQAMGQSDGSDGRWMRNRMN